MIASAAIDTNILLYAHFDDYPEYKLVRPWLTEFLENCEIFFLSWQVVYEYVRIVTHPKILRKPLGIAQAAEDVKKYHADSRCRMLQETSEHLATVMSIWKDIPTARGNFVHDTHYAALLKEHAVKTVVTADSDFLKFRFLNVVNPTLPQ